MFKKIFSRIKKSFNLKHLKEVYFPNGKISKKEFIKLFFKTIAAGILIVMVLFIWYAKDLPTPAKLKNLHPIESTKIYDRNGQPLYDVHGDIKRTVIDAKDIPENIKQATIAAEDKDFYKHHGISFTGIGRSLLNNITGKKGYVAGGSTITQQFVKNALLSSQKTYSRKLKELILTLEIEFTYSKDQILTMYLNQIPYGSNAYGIEAASQTFFGKPAKDLTVSEAANLAAMPKAPTYYSPYGQHPDKLKERQEYILGRMATLNLISKEDAETAKAQKVNFQSRRENVIAPHFVFYVKEKLIEEYGEQLVNEGGLKVTTTLDLDKQKIAENVISDAADKNLKKFGANNAALVSIDPKTGQILSMVGSKDFFDAENDGQVNVAIADRQPGSSFKPIVYAAAFQKQYNPGYTLFDLKTDFGGGYTPNNYTGQSYGPVSMRFALANSLNISAVKTLYLAGMNETLDLAHKMGISTLNEPDRYGLALVLGGGEVKLADLTTAYGVFADEGTLHQTTPILKVEDNSGKTLYEFNEKKGKRDVLDPQIAYEISDILSNRDTRKAVFGNISAFNIGDRRVAVKTGTTQEFHDAWTVGYTPSVVTGVWVGNNDNSAMNNHADGSMVAAPIWNSYMSKVLNNTPEEDFNRPEGIQEITVDKLSNKLPTYQSPETIKDIFSSWQAPTKKDDIHITADICKLCDDEKLAGDNCPESQIENRVYTNLHSEVPTNPNWEAPVMGWAKANGISVGAPPKQTCDMESSRPSITISNPQSNQIVSGNFDLTVQTNSVFGISYVEYLIDNISIGKANTSPYGITYNANNLSVGTHQLKAKAIDNKGLSAENTVTFITDGNTTPPGNVSNVTLTPGSGLMTIAWKNPSDSDFTSVRIYISKNSGQLGNLHPTETSGVPNGSSQQTINGLVSSTKYYFTLHPIDASGNENTSATQYSAAAL